MCGICGIVDFSSTEVNKGQVWPMVESLCHRGPDDFGVAPLGKACLGQTRLSIIDLTPSGHQPMRSADGRVTIAYNGEVYNYLDLKHILEGKGVRFRGTSDTEVVLQSYIQWGEDAFLKFNGMFSLAVWDGRSEELHLVRDRLGIKPLYYWEHGETIVFGSEIKAILRSGLVDARMNTRRLHEYLYYGTVGGEHTLFEGIAKLLPGHRLQKKRKGTTLKPYWSVFDISPCNDDESTATEKVRGLLDASAKRHLLSDVPVGIFLSGGIDSSAIAALASKHHPGRLQTYTAGFDFAGNKSELPKARSMAEYCDTDHHELHIQGDNVQEVIEQLVCAHDEPFADAANIPLYLLCEQLKGKVKVVLQGDGGDEVFAGYRRYNVFSHERFWRCVSPLAKAVNLFRNSGAAHFRNMRFFHAISQRDPVLRSALMLTMEPYNYPPTTVLSSDIRSEVSRQDPFVRYRAMYHKLKALDPVQRALYMDMVILLPDIFLEKVDKSTMAQSMEIRVPLLDNNIVEYVLSLPSSMKVRRGQKKWLLRRALRGVVPDDILDAPKQGFSVPYSFWLRTSLKDYVKSVLFDPSIRQWGLFDERELAGRIDDHAHERRDNGFLLYKILNLALWYREYID